jgi:hypothetical protein
MITTVKIGYLTYTVVVADQRAEDGLPHLPTVADDTWLSGEISFSKARIFIHAALAEEVQKQTLLHEITHGVFHHAGQHAYCANEEMVDTVAYGFMALIRDNPELIAYLQEQPHE